MIHFILWAIGVAAVLYVVYSNLDRIKSVYHAVVDRTVAFYNAVKSFVVGVVSFFKKSE